MQTTIMGGRGKRRRKMAPILGLLLLFFLSATAVAFAWWSSQPNRAHVKPDYMAKAHPIMSEGDWTGDYALGEGEGIWIPLPLAKELIGDGVRYEAETDSVILTSDTSVLHFKTGKLSATLNAKPFNMSFGAKKAEDGTLYLPFAPLQQLFGLTAVTDADTGIVTLTKPGRAIQKGEAPARGKAPNFAAPRENRIRSCTICPPDLPSSYGEKKRAGIEFKPPMVILVMRASAISRWSASRRRLRAPLPSKKSRMCRGR